MSTRQIPKKNECTDHNVEENKPSTSKGQKSSGVTSTEKFYDIKYASKDNVIDVDDSIIQIIDLEKDVSETPTSKNCELNCDKVQQQNTKAEKKRPFDLLRPSKKFDIAAEVSKLGTLEEDKEN